MSFGKLGIGFGDGGNGGGGGAGIAWQQLQACFEVGQAGSPMVDGQSIYTNALLLNATNVRVFVSGIVLPSIALSTGGRYVIFTPGNAFLQIYGAVNNQEYINIDYAK